MLMHTDLQEGTATGDIKERILKTSRKSFLNRSSIFFFSSKDADRFIKNEKDY